MKKVLGHLAVAVLFGATWPFLVGGADPATSGARSHWLLDLMIRAFSPDRDLATVVLLLVMMAAQYLAVVGLAALLQPLGRAIYDASAAYCALMLRSRISLPRTS
jgi:hypothetical protein